MEERFGSQKKLLKDPNTLEVWPLNESGKLPEQGATSLRVHEKTSTYLQGGGPELEAFPSAWNKKFCFLRTPFFKHALQDGCLRPDHFEDAFAIVGMRSDACMNAYSLLIDLPILATW
jgi:hypothetical protein